MVLLMEVKEMVTRVCINIHGSLLVKLLVTLPVKVPVKALVTVAIKEC
jgi:hypothetical protein